MIHTETEKKKKKVTQKQIAETGWKFICSKNFITALPLVYEKENRKSFYSPVKKVQV